MCRRRGGHQILIVLVLVLELESRTPGLLTKTRPSRWAGGHITQAMTQSLVNLPARIIVQQLL